MNLIALLVVVISVSFMMTAVLRQYAIARSIVDVPNSRSSHAVPTPRGGGVAIVFAFLLSLVILAFFKIDNLNGLIAIAGAGGLIAIVGFIDDHGHIPARWRLLGHIISAIWALFWLGEGPPVAIAGFEINLGWFGAILATLYLVWLLNLYNFMDGIDGIASIEAVTACLSACVLYWLSGYDQLIIVPLLLAAAVLGFLYWNFPPAKIFMGDAGSGFLGIVLGVLSLQAAWLSFNLFWCWLILLGVFIVDATFTLIRRLLRGEKVYEAHRSHAYQFASRLYGKHLPVTLAVLALNIFWLLPLSLCVMLLGLDGVIGVVLAYSPLVFLAVWYRAGGQEPSR